MSGIDELSKQLGSIETTLRYIAEASSNAEKKLDKLNDNIILHEASLKSAHRRIDEMAIHVEDYKRMKNRGLGALAFITLLCGSLGVFLGKLIQGLM